MSSSKRTNEADMDEPSLLVSSAVADVFERLGLRRVLGRIWVLLYLSYEPLNVYDLKKKLNISSGSLSTGLNELLDLGLAHRSTLRGQRRFYYEAETEMWSLFTRLFKERERILLIESLEKLKEAEKNMQRVAETKPSSFNEHRLDRIRHLVGLGEFVLGVLDAFVERTRIELKAAQKWLSVSGRLGSEPLLRLRKRIRTLTREINQKKD